MSEQQFLWNSLDGGENVFIKERGSDKIIHIKIIEGKHEFVDFMKKVNEQQELIEELQVSDEMGWKRAEMFEKKCPKELHNKKMYIKRLEYKVQKFKEENEQLQKENNILNNNEDDLKECTLKNIQLKEENQELKRLIKKMGELGGFNKHLIKTICEDLE